MLGYERLGSGSLGVIVLHDWLCDTSTWDSVRFYLNGEQFTWVFTDLRGYGKSRSETGTYTLEEAAADVVSLLDTLGWQRAVIVGHSMSTLVALHLAQTAPDRIDRAVLVCPVPPSGLGVDASMVEALTAVANGDDTQRIQAMKYAMGDRLSDGWLRYKVTRWRATSDPEAVTGYVPLFAENGVPNPKATVTVPLLAVTGEQDDAPMRSAAVQACFSPLCPNLTVAPIAECGHYPMQETPPLLATILERFLRQSAT